MDNAKHMKRLFLIIAVMLSSIGISAQSDKFGMWTSVEVDKKINKKWTVGLEVEQRTQEGHASRWTAGVAATYKIAKWLKVSAGYSLLNDKNNRYTCDYTRNGFIDKEKRAEYWGIRHRFNVSLTGEKRFGRFDISLRERWQYTYRPEKTVTRTVTERDYLDADGTEWEEDVYDEEKTYRGKGKNVLRSRLQVEYDIKRCPVEPYASAELYNAWNIYKVRYTVGADWKINKQHTLGISYKFQDMRNSSDDDPDPDLHVLGLSYKFKF